MASVQLDHVRKRYENGHVAVHDASFEVEDGEFVVLVGPSGCGKSTMLRMIAGLESITQGVLQIDGREMNDVAPKNRDIAMVFQNYALYPHMSAYDNMAFGLKLRKHPKSEIDRRVRKAADILGLDTILERKPKQLSGGQRQRVALGRAIVRNPAAFLFDEPLSNLDAKLRVQMRTEISKLHQELGATMIYVTHDQTEAMTMGDRIVVLREGHVQQIAPPLELYNRPANRFVAGFIGSPAMNFFEGRCTWKGDTFQFVSEELCIQLRPEWADNMPERVIAGIRPEDVYVAGSSSRNIHFGELKPFRIDVLEPMGNEVFVYAARGDTSLVARVKPQALPDPGETISLSIDLDKVHLFDAETEENLFVFASQPEAVAA